MRKFSWVLAMVFGFGACTAKDDPGDDVTVHGDDDPYEIPDEDGQYEGIVPPSPYTKLDFNLQDVEVATPDKGAGIQGKLLRGDDGTLYYAYMKFDGTSAKEGTACDRAVFGGGPAPNLVYHLRVAVQAPGGDWSLETVPLENVPAPGNIDALGARFGLDGTIDNAGHPVFAFAGGGGGLGTCSSSDLVLATRSGANAYDFDVPTTGSASCCNDCVDPACTSGDTVGVWAAIGTRPAGLGVAYSDFHNYWDEDGQTHQGFEIWEDGAFDGIRSWSGMGAYAQLRYRDDGVPIAAYGAHNGGGIYISYRDGADWVERDLRPGAEIGERLSLAIAPDGVTVGLAAYVRTTSLGAPAEDLIYCRSPDAGVTWAVLDLPGAPACESVDTQGVVGLYPSLAFDSQNRPAISYYYCGTDTACPASGDGLRFAWKDTTTLVWKKWTVYNNASAKVGYYTSLVMDSATDQPTITFHDLTRGAAMVATGVLE